MNEEKIREMLSAHKIVERGHFKLASGRHSDLYVNKNALFANTELSAFIVAEMVKDMLDEHPDMPYPDGAVGPMFGGALMAHLTAAELNKYPDYESDDDEPVFAAFTEPGPNKTQVLKRGYDKLVRGKKILLVEDVITTGETITQTARAVLEAGGIVLAVGVFWNRGYDKTLRLLAPAAEIPIIATIEQPIGAWYADECNLCVDGVPLNEELGHAGKTT